MSTVSDSDNAIVNFSAVQGADFIESISRTESGVTVDLTGYQAFFAVYRRYPKTFLHDAYNTSILLDASTINSRITISSVYLILNIDATLVDSLDAGAYDYYLDIISPGGVYTRILSGLFDVVQESSY